MAITKEPKLNFIIFRPTKEIKKKLIEVAKITDRPKSFIIKKALEIYLNDYIDYQIALDRLNDKDDNILTNEEFWENVNQNE